jgi:hypothetical protein
MRSKRLPAPEKLILQLTPRTTEFGDLISRAGFNPKLQYVPQQNFSLFLLLLKASNIETHTLTPLSFSPSLIHINSLTTDSHSNRRKQSLQSSIT